MKLRLASVLVVTTALLLFGTGQALADPITYTVTSTGTGTLGSISFTNAALTVSLTGDTLGVTNPSSGLFENFGLATVTVFGVGTATLTGSIFAFDVQTGDPTAGISDFGVNDVLDTQNLGFGSYDLKSAISLTGATNFVPTDPHVYGTNLGNLVLTGMGSTSTFTAKTVPEPATLWLLGAGAMFLFRRRK
jgi:hypothetical protein